MNLHRIIATAVATTLITNTPTSAYDLEVSSFGSQIGLIIGSAQKCNYQLNDDAISKLVESRVPPENLDFAGMFQMQIGYHRSETEALTGIELRLRCETVLRSAVELGLAK